MTETPQEPVLPEDADIALEKMILLSKEMIKSYESESNAVAMGDDLEFLQSTGTKQALGVLYQKAAAEFLERKDEFAKADAALLATFADLQEQLKAEAKTNMTILGPVVQQLQDNQNPDTASKKAS